MARVHWRNSFAGEHMAEMSPAVCAANLRALPVGVVESPDGARDLLVEARPSAVSVEFRLRAVERRSAPPADVHSRRPVVLELAGVRPLRRSVDDDGLLRRGELPVRCLPGGRHRSTQPEPSISASGAGYGDSREKARSRGFFEVAWG